MTVELMATEVHLEHQKKFPEVTDVHKHATQLCQTKLSGSKRDSLSYYSDPNPCKKRKFAVDRSCHDIGNTNVDDPKLAEVHVPYQPSLLETATDTGTNSDVITSCEQTISIHETYQLAYLDSNCDENDSGSLYVFDFVDGLEVTYPISVSNPESFTFDMPPLFVEPQYTDQLSALATEALNQLTQRINSWLSACQKADENFFVWRHLRTHNSTIELRKIAFRLISNLAPQMKRFTFDPHSPTVDKLFSKLLHNMQNKFSSKDSKIVPEKCKTSQPIVSLCPDADHCLNNLRDQLIQLLQCLLPNLSLPPTFDPEIDLIPLIETICGYNTNSP